MVLNVEQFVKKPFVLVKYYNFHGGYIFCEFISMFCVFSFIYVFAEVKALDVN